MKYDSGSVPNYDALIVGAGFAGIYQLYHLRKLGYQVKLIEAGSDIGGIWYWNCYPGARVDSLGAIYQFSDPTLWEDWDYSEKFPSWQEVRAYFDHVDSKWDVRKDCIFNTRVVKAWFNEATHLWHIEGANGEEWTARYFIPCLGFASKPNIPEFKDHNKYKGNSWHTALWPQEDYDMTDKKVAVIGTGASAVQVIQEASKVAAHVTVFQRTPNLTIPMRQRKITKEENKKLKDHYPELFEVRKTTFAGFEFDMLPQGVIETENPERERLFREVWETGAFNWWLGNFNDVLIDPIANRKQYEFWRKETIKRIKKPELIEKLAPSEPPHPYGTKRPCLEQWYYECFNQDNVELVDLNEEPIKSFTENGLSFGDREQDFDLVVFATGFDAVTGGLTAIDIVGTDGQTLCERWDNGILTYLGVAVDKFPNMLMIYAPQSPSGFCNGPTCAELQGEWVVDFIRAMDEKGVTRVEASKEAAEEWRQKTLDIIDGTLFPQANSWYMGANIPGKHREILVFPGGLSIYTEAIEEEARAGYPNFHQVVFEQKEKSVLTN